MKRETLTREIHDRIVAYVRQGIPARTAAIAAGISGSAFEEWFARGRDAPRGKYRAFHDALVVAEAQYETDLVIEVYDGAQKNEKLGFAFMERRHAEIYGRQRLLPNHHESPGSTVAPKRLLLPAEEPLRAVTPKRRSDGEP